MADSPRIEELKRRVQSDPASIAFAALAEEYRRAGRFEDAINTCTAGLIRHPSYLSAHVTLGRALLDLGRLEDARKQLESVLKLAPENLAAIRGLAEIHDRMRDEAPGHRPAAQAPQPADAQMTVAEIHAASGFIPPAQDEAVHTQVSSGAVADARMAQPTPSDVEESERPPDDSTATEEHVPAEMPQPAEESTHIRQPSTEAAALAGLEEFLKAILRARAERAAAR